MGPVPIPKYAWKGFTELWNRADKILFSIIESFKVFSLFRIEGDWSSLWRSVTDLKTWWNSVLWDLKSSVRLLSLLSVNPGRLTKGSSFIKLVGISSFSIRSAVWIGGFLTGIPIGT